METKENWQGSLPVIIIVAVILVAVAYIAVAYIFVYPLTYGRERIPAQKPNCSNYLKRCAIALQCYSADYDNQLPSSMIVNHSKKWNKQDFETFATKAGELPAKGKPQTWVQLLYPHMTDKDVIYCPSDSTDHTKPNSQPSYWWKCAIDKAWYGEECKKSYRKISDFVYASDQILLYERTGFHGGEPGLKNDVVINVLYLDTHIRNVSLANTSKDYNSKGYITDPTAPGEPAYFNFDITKVKDTDPTNEIPDNPPSADKATTFIDPARYGDMLQ